MAGSERQFPDTSTATHAGDYGEAYPGSYRVYEMGTRGVRVPMREIRLSGGQPPLRVYSHLFIKFFFRQKRWTLKY